MTIVLTIDSLDALPDGGPIRFSARNRSFEIGRQQHLDWTLPDPNRYVSGVHCEVRFEKGGYWLYDVSRNGTFVNGASQRVKSPYRLEHGDRLTIGHYIVAVELPDAAALSPPPGFDAPLEPSPAASSGDIWDVGSATPPPIDRRELMPKSSARREADFGSQFIDLPSFAEPAQRPPARPDLAPPHAAPAPPEPRSAPWPAALPEEPSAPSPRSSPVEPVPPLPRAAEPASPRPRAMPFEGESFAPVPVETPSGLGPDAARERGQNRGDAGRFLSGLAAGAGVPPDTFAGRDPEELGREMGSVLRVAVEQMSQMLRARAAAKAMTRSSSRTMIGATDNNALKFIPAPADAIETMFTGRRPGFLGARASFEAGFADLKRHELATYAAMQKALARLMDDFAPDGLLENAGGSAFASRKSRAWDQFAQRWEEKSAKGDNGMLDTFLAYFAEAYDEASRKV
jgi:type VI secretion system protein ImpI